MAQALKSIDKSRFSLYCDIDVPYGGFVDDGGNTYLGVSAQINKTEYLSNNGYYIRKEVKMSVNRVVHIVKRGDNLSSLAHRYGTTINEIAHKNGIQDVDLIIAGTVLNIDIDKELIVVEECLYPIDNSIGKSPFDTFKEDKTYNPSFGARLINGISDYYTASETALEAVSKGFGNTRVGDNGKYYYKSLEQGAFWGNKSVKTSTTVFTNIAEFASKLGRYTKIPIIDIICEYPDIEKGIWEDSGKTLWDGGWRDLGHNTIRETVGAASNISVGAGSGAIAGSAVKLGVVALATKYGILGSVAGPVGTVIGVVVGALVGYYLGNYIEDVVEDVYNSKLIDNK